MTQKKGIDTEIWAAETCGCCLHQKFKKGDKIVVVDCESWLSSLIGKTGIVLSHPSAHDLVHVRIERKEYGLPPDDLRLMAYEWDQERI